MKERIERFIGKHAIVPADITYIIRDQSKTCIHMTDGRTVETYFSIKKLLEVLEVDDFLSVNKGVTLSRSHVVCVKNGIYLMDDGRELRGRVRTPGEHKRNGAFVTAVKAVDIASNDGLDLLSPENIAKRFAILDNLPIPFGVFEIIFDGEVPVDIVFRYLNKEMAELTNGSVKTIIDRSFYSVFENGDRKWIEINMEVATTGEPRTVRRFSPEVGRYLSLYYYCPLKGYCACALI